MRFLLYNMRYGAGIGRHFHFPVPYSGYLKRTGNNLCKIIDFIKSTNPDIVGLLEVDSGSWRTGKNNQAMAIAQELKHFYVVHSKYSYNSIFQKVPVLNKQCNAFITNQEIMTKKFHYFKQGIKRLIIELEFKDYKIFLVHLSLKFRHRLYQLNDLYSLINNTSKPVIVAGDFNSFRGNHELDLFLAATGLKSVNDVGKPSHPSRSPRRQLDYILKSQKINSIDFQIPEVKLSDHSPLIFDFEIK